MGKKISLFLAAMVGVLSFASAGHALDNIILDNNEGNDRIDSTVVQPPSYQGQVIQIPACKNEGSSLICRWDNLQVDYINTRLTTTFNVQAHTLTIKAKDKEISLVTIPDSKPHYVNAIAGCERMAIAARAGQGLFSFYVIANGSAISQAEAAFQSNKVSISANLSGYSEVGCFLSAGN